jgi:hypothetical protein
MENQPYKPKRVGEWKLFIPLSEYSNSGSWLEREKIRQKMLGVKTYETFIFRSNKNPLLDELVSTGVVEEKL